MNVDCLVLPRFITIRGAIDTTTRLAFLSMPTAEFIAGSTRFSLKRLRLNKSNRRLNPAATAPVSKLCYQIL